MDISNINGISTGDIKSFFNNTSLTKTDKTDSFSDVLSAAMGSIGETNDLQNAAEQEEVRFALGESDNTHDLLVAETKAAVALQYTVAVRDKMIVTQEELKTMLVKSLDNLTEKERRVIELYYYEDLTLKEISNILEVSESRVSQLHTKGLIKMRKVMGPYMNILTNA